MPKFEWDTAKSEVNERNRGLPFKVALALFAGNTYEWDDVRLFYGERRMRLRYGASFRFGERRKGKRMSIARFSSSEPVDLSDVDWERVKGFTDDDIDRQISEDPDVAPDCSAMGPGRVVLAPEALDVKALRKRMGYSLDDFAHHYGIPVETVREWEEGGNVPEGPARVLLQIIVREPEAVERALYASKAR